ncbi:DUF3999 domain-containing protein [Pseudomonas sp. JS3066]|uniref:DUF3999 domain-containing protein n=1 Tax=Pseudomonas sp. JS3066 TaxID=3090665 RepID=UPI002E7C1B1F|nr:DUF3999 domain-containing protein [Pseudomonas sp. JS3066]WVK92779.1 DUF3999 domain-containing protein [Pseudomonas sp. JS3066]
MIGLSCLRRPGLALLASLGLLCQPLLAAEQPDDFTTRVELRLDGQGPWYRMDLPMALHFAAQHADLRDLRVFNAEGESLAYALTRSSASERRARHEQTVRWFPLRGPADGSGALPSVRIERSTTGTVVQVVPENPVAEGEQLRGWLLDVSGVGAPLEKLSLEWNSAADGFQHFSIEASDDLQHWESWGDGQVARLSFADQRIDQREVALPGRSARYLRLLWQSPRHAAELTAVKVSSASRESLPAAMAWSAPLDPVSSKAGQYIWDLPLGLPIERLRVAVERPGSLLPVQVEARRDGAPQWQPVMSGLLYRLPQDGKEVAQEELDLPGWMAIKQLRLTVDQRAGGFGQQVPRLEVGMHATQVVFLARGNPPFTLALGNLEASRAELPLSTLVPGFDSASLEKMGRAEAVAIPAQTGVHPAERQAAGQIVWKRVGLWAVLLLGVGLLGGMAFSLLRRPAARS